MKLIKEIYIVESKSNYIKNCEKVKGKVYFSLIRLHYFRRRK